MFIEKINQVNERVEELNKAKENINSKIEELKGMLKDIENETLVLIGSYNTLVALGTEIGEIEKVVEDGKVKIVPKQQKEEKIEEEKVSDNEADPS